jgi:hypothetical protein
MGTLVTVSAPRTVKLAKLDPSNGVAKAGAAAQNTASTAKVHVDNDFSVPPARVLFACLDAIFILLSLWDLMEDSQVG